MNNAQAPAYPPQVLLDNFQRPVAPFPGFTKQEAAALAILPYFLELAERKNTPAGGFVVNAIHDALDLAEHFCHAFDKRIRDARTPELTAIHEA